MQSVLNLTEILNKNNLNKVPPLLKGKSRVYLGSYFCGNYFLNKVNLIKEFLNQTDLNITLVLPIFTQKLLKPALEKIEDLLQNEKIDEITVNDYGMYEHFKNFKPTVNLGRLFFKDARDFRMPEMLNGEAQIKSSSLYSLLKPSGLCEIDPISSNLKLENIPTALHYPYCYQSTGQICKFGSINQDIKLKFRPNGGCQSECERIHEYFLDDFGDGEKEIFRYGRTVYFLNPIDYQDLPISRLIEFPLKELAI